MVFALVSGFLTTAWPVQPAGAAEGVRLVRTLHSLTGVHEWYVQTYAGYPVLDSYYARHLDASGNVVSVQDGRLAVSGLGSATPTIDAARARMTAGAANGRAELVVVSGSPARLAWAVVRSGVRTLVDASTGSVIGRTDLRRYEDGKGRVFDPNPVVTLQDESLTDQKDADYAALQPAYKDVTLTNLDGSGYLRGDYANIGGTGKEIVSSSLEFLFGRSQYGFERTMSYYDVTQAQVYIQSLGFTDVNNEPQDVHVNQYGGDNSFYDPSKDLITFGKGGVDDAEDAEVIWHELGHAIQDSQVPGFGVGHDAGSIGEGFGDYWAATMSEPVSDGFGVTCIADWDSISYTTTVPHCLRRTDLDLTVADENGRIHHDGQIWSRALWDIHQWLGRTTADTIILEAQFSFAPDTSFADAALATVAAAEQVAGHGAAIKVEKAFQDRGIL